jgi:hypothetical protein
MPEVENFNTLKFECDDDISLRKALNFGPKPKNN